MHRDPEGDLHSYCIDGFLEFGELSVTRADRSAVSLATFMDDGQRWWQALHDRDPRLSSEAQRAAAAGAPHWPRQHVDWMS